MNNKNLSQRDQLQQKYNSARMNLLLMIALTAINIVLYFTGSQSMMLFSASIPYYAVIFGCEIGFEIIAIPCYILAGILVVAYFLCWLLSKKRYGWLIPALVLFVLDILAMAALYIWFADISGILDVLIHIWVLYYLIVGISSGSKLKKMPAEVVPDVPEENPVLVNSTPLRRIGEDEKARVLLEETYGTYRICYRRVKKLNQLVINDYIYDEVEYLVEPPHSLHAVMDGSTIEVGYDGKVSYLCVNGTLIRKKIRWY